MLKFKKIAIKSLYKTNENSGCIASNRITVDGMKVGYMYRELTDSSFPDSGWRFFAGDEDDEYTNNPDNFHIFNLTIKKLSKNIYNIIYKQSIINQ